MAQTSLADQGIAAFEAGNLAESRKLLAQAVKVDRDNEMAWYYLSKTQTDTDKRRYCLQMVLNLNPDNLAAQRDLESMDEAAPKSKVVEDVDFRAAPGKAKSETSFAVRVPAGIAGAPDRVSLDYTRDFVQETARDSLTLFTGKQSLVTAEASWWRVIFTVGLTGFVIGLLFDLAEIINVLQLSQYGARLSVGTLLLRPFLTAFMALVAVGAGVFISHWYITTQRGGTGNQLDHALLMTKIWAPASLLLAILAFVGLLFRQGIPSLQSLIYGSYIAFDAGTLLFSLIALGITVYAAYLMVRGMQKLYPSISDNSLWITAFIMLIVTALVF